MKLLSAILIAFSVLTFSCKEDEPDPIEETTYGARIELVSKSKFERIAYNGIVFDGLSDEDPALNPNLHYSSPNWFWYDTLTLNKGANYKIDAKVIRSTNVASKSDIQFVVSLNTAQIQIIKDSTSYDPSYNSTGTVQYYDASMTFRKD